MPVLFENKTKDGDKYFGRDQYFNSVIVSSIENLTGKIKDIKTPILIMHGKKDNIVPQKMGLELFEKANNPKFSYFPESDDHMMEYNSQLLNKIKLFISKI